MNTIYNQNVELKNKYASLKIKNIDLKDNIYSLENEIIELRQNNFSCSNKNLELNKKNYSLLNDNALLKDKITSLTKKNSDFIKLNKKYSLLFNENTLLKEQITSLIDKEKNENIKLNIINSSNEKIKELESENAKLIQKNKILELSDTELIVKLDKKIHDLKEELNIYKPINNEI